MSQACRARRDLSNGVKIPKPELDRTFVHGTLAMSFEGYNATGMGHSDQQ